MMHEALAALMGLVEGITEFLPVSSTGHLILAAHWIGFNDAIGKDAADCFSIFIQLGAILAVVAAFPGRFVGLLDLRANSGFAGPRGIALLMITTLPALVVGFLLHATIKERLFNPMTVAVGLAVGSVWILAVEWRGTRPRCTGLDELSWREALAVGLFQCVAMWPGMSRAGATILGGMMVGIDRKTATQYSFFAAVPALSAAAIYDVFKSREYLAMEHLPLFAIGFVASFIFAYVAVKWLVRFVGAHTLTPFAWYRLALAGVVLWALWGQSLADLK
jgi:undecaprenyl-diphosphatase